MHTTRRSKCHVFEPESFLDSLEYNNEPEVHECQCHLCLVLNQLVGEVGHFFIFIFFVYLKSLERDIKKL